MAASVLLLYCLSQLDIDFWRALNYLSLNFALLTLFPVQSSLQLALFSSNDPKKRDKGSKYMPSFYGFIQEEILFSTEAE